ncbi:DNA-binding protein [Nocardia sp. NPDC059228]|uniref:DNA-binding protein n=1 Tax=Nocardia sp. NPDC059228 TaxID=3346777 RepID=UPI0036C37834
MNETRTYTLAEVVERVDVPSELWLRRRLNAGILRGRRAGRIWSMTESDIAYLLEYMARGPKAAAAEQVAPTPAPPVVSVAAGLSAKSRKRLSAKSA